MIEVEGNRHRETQAPTVRAYRIAYDGQPYHGFQRQPDVVTVERTLLDALVALDVLDSRGEIPPGYAAAGRTDAGVSALAQTVAFDAPEWLTPAAFNSELPASIRAWASADAPNGFHATHHASSRTYTYVLYAPETEVVGRSEAGVVDTSETAVDRAREFAERLSGEHDFHNLTPDDEGTVRDLTVSVERDNTFLVWTFHAGGFARQLVRRLVGLLEECLRGDAGPERIDAALGPESLTGPEGIAPAPPEPLVLTDVSYPDLDFVVDEEASHRTRKLFEQLRVERSTGARVAGILSEAGSE